jgi:hypothetical protein
MAALPRLPSFLSRSKQANTYMLLLLLKTRTKKDATAKAGKERMISVIKSRYFRLNLYFTARSKEFRRSVKTEQ